MKGVGSAARKQTTVEPRQGKRARQAEPCCPRSSLLLPTLEPAAAHAGALLCTLGAPVIQRIFERLPQQQPHGFHLRYVAALRQQEGGSRGGMLAWGSVCCGC